MQGVCHPKTQIFNAWATRRYQGIALTKGVLGAIPFVGSFVAEVVGQIIPEQRTERLESFVRLLGERLSVIEKDDLGARFRQPENVDLFEEGAIQAARDWHHRHGRADAIHAKPHSRPRLSDSEQVPYSLNGGNEINLHIEQCR